MTTLLVEGTPFGDITPQVQKALDKALTRTLELQQGNLNKQPPFDSGRMASSWRIGKNKPRTDADRGENWESSSGVAWDYEGEITFDGDWYISNAVPYAQPVALLGSYPPSWDPDALPPSLPQGWFTTIANQTGNVFNAQYKRVSP